MNELLLLTGANGRTGRATLVKMTELGVPVRALIRNPEQADALLNLGASECVVGDLLDAPSMERAIRGAGKLMHIGPPMHPEELAITSTLVDLAKAEDVQHFIYYSVMHPLARAMRHHRLKLDSEEYLVNSGIPHSIVQPARYMQHLEPMWSEVLNEGVHALPFGVDSKLSIVDAVDVAEACAIIATRSDFIFGTYELAGPQALSQLEMAEILSEELRRPVAARTSSLDEAREKYRSLGMAEERISLLETMNRHYDEHGFRSNAMVLEMILARPATRFRDYVRRVMAERGI